MAMERVLDGCESSNRAGNHHFDGGIALRFVSRQWRHGKLSGIIYCDTNQNCSTDECDWGIAEAEISLTKVGSSDPAIIVLSGKDGSFSFTGLSAGTYTISMLTPLSQPGTDMLGMVYDKSGKAIAANQGTASTNTFSNIVLLDGYSGINYTFIEPAYPVAAISKRMLLNTPFGSEPPQPVQPVPEPGSLLLLAVAAMALVMWKRHGRD